MADQIDWGAWFHAEAVIARSNAMLLRAMLTGSEAIAQNFDQFAEVCEKAEASGYWKQVEP